MKEVINKFEVPILLATIAILLIQLGSLKFASVIALLSIVRLFLNIKEQ